ALHGNFLPARCAGLVRAGEGVRAPAGRAALLPRRHRERTHAETPRGVPRGSVDPGNAAATPARPGVRQRDRVTPGVSLGSCYTRTRTGTTVPHGGPNHAARIVGSFRPRLLRSVLGGIECPPPGAGRRTAAEPAGHLRPRPAAGSRLLRLAGADAERGPAGEARRPLRPGVLPAGAVQPVALVLPHRPAARHAARLGQQHPLPREEPGGDHAAAVVQGPRL